MGKSLKKGSAEALRPGAQSHTYPSLKQGFVKKDNAGHTRLALSLEPPLLQSNSTFSKFSLKLQVALLLLKPINQANVKLHLFSCKLMLSKFLIQYAEKSKKSIFTLSARA